MGQGQSGPAGPQGPQGPQGPDGRPDANGFNSFMNSEDIPNLKCFKTSQGDAPQNFPDGSVMDNYICFDNGIAHNLLRSNIVLTEAPSDKKCMTVDRTFNKAEPTCTSSDTSCDTLSRTPENMTNVIACGGDEHNMMFAADIAKKGPT